jgi:hypothetical protein
MSECSSNARQFTIRERPLAGPVLYVRQALPSMGTGTFEWGKWRKARPSEIQMAIIKLAELQKS